ncbi:DNA adenine methylase [Serratia marcescens]
MAEFNQYGKDTADKRLVEPFVGSGAVFLNTDYESYLLCDIRPRFTTSCSATGAASSFK